jgi:uncharacterized repeat protein (TIGR03943 family)
VVRRAVAQSIVLLLIGGTLLKIAATGTYVRYVKVEVRWYLVVAGAVLVVVAAANLVHLLRTVGRDHPVAESHEHRGAEPSWLLVVPALALLLIAPPALGSYTASRDGTALPAATSEYPPLPDGDPVRLSVLDYASRAVYDKSNSLGQRRVTLSGFLVAGGDGRHYLARMVITCCAADARPVKVGLAGDVPSDVAADAWLEVTGTHTPRTDTDPVNGEPIPYLTVTTAKVIPAPKQQYES